MIVGVGIELVETARFEASVARFGPRLSRRVFTADEWGYAARKNRGQQSLAVRFAAKLAARRALDSPGVALRDLEVVRTGHDAPQLRLRGNARRVAQSLGVQRIALTLTHDAHWCVGQVILESDS